MSLRRILPALAITAAIVTTACSTDDEPTPTPTRVIPTPIVTVEPVKAALGERFTLQPGKTAFIPEARILIFFAQVTNDSRCPVDVTCIRAGDATVELSVSSSIPGVLAPALQLKLVVGAENPSAATGQAYGYAITALGLAPAPRSTQPIAQQDYMVTLVARAG